MIEKTISHYKIITKIGQGGLGEVYKAEDLKLKRTVALKFPQRNGFMDPKFKEDLMNEAQMAAALNHPNIATIYEIGEIDKQCYIAMEYIGGETLREKNRTRTA